MQSKGDLAAFTCTLADVPDPSNHSCRYNNSHPFNVTAKTSIEGLLSTLQLVHNLHGVLALHTLYLNLTSAYSQFAGSGRVG
jgi:hypothetical protein